MEGIRSYTNTKNELKIVEQRLLVLKQKREELFNRLCVPKGWQVGEGGGTPTTQSATERYVLMINEPNKATGMSINQEIEQCEADIKRLRWLLNIMEEALGQLTGIEARLFQKIAVEGMKPTEAVAFVADEQFMSTDNIWHTYYRRIKPYIDILTVK